MPVCRQTCEWLKPPSRDSRKPKSTADPLALRNFGCPNAVSGDIFEQLALQLIAVHQHQHGGFFRFPAAAQQSGSNGYHRQRLTAALRVPDQSSPLNRVVNPFNHLLHRTGLVLAQHDFSQLVILAEEDNRLA